MKIYKYEEYAEDNSLLSKGFILKTEQGDRMIPPAFREEEEITIEDLILFLKNEKLI